MALPPLGRGCDCDDDDNEDDMAVAPAAVKDDDNDDDDDDDTKAAVRVWDNLVDRARFSATAAAREVLSWPTWA